MIGAIASVVPLLAHITTSSFADLSGSASYRDWLAISCGAFAGLCGLATLAGARARLSTPAVGLAMVILLVGVYHVARGVRVIG